MTGGVSTAVVVVGAFGFGADAAVGAGIIGPTSGAGGGFETVDGVVAELVAWAAVTAAGRPLIEDWSAVSSVSRPVRSVPSWAP